jgi:hypothetical protein
LLHECTRAYVTFTKITHGTNAKKNMKSKWKKKLKVISFYIWIDLILITIENIPPKLIYELVQSMVPLLWSHICLFKLSHHDYVVVHHLCKHIKGLVMEIQTLSIWLWNFGLWSCSPHDENDV